MDTLRADHLPAYGYAGVATPHLDALRRDSILFANAYFHVPLTLPSHVCLFTGLLPPQNGVRDNIGYALAPGIPTLASLLKQAGYATGGAVSSILLARSTGVDRGFDFYEDDIEPTAPNQSLGRVQRDGGRTLDLLRAGSRGPGEKDSFSFFISSSPSRRTRRRSPTRADIRLPTTGRSRVPTRSWGNSCGF